MANSTLDYSFLESCDLFCGIPGAIQMEVIARSYTRRFARREVLFLTGDRITQVFLLVDGCAKITHLNERGNEVILRLRKGGDLIGMPVWEPGDLHSSAAEALAPCKVLAWDAQKFELLKERFPQLQRNANDIIVRALAKLAHRYCEVVSTKVAFRLAYGLVHVLEEVGQKVNNHVEVKLSREELGQMTAVSPSEVSRVLSRWERQGLVRLGREVIEVPSAARLLGYCEGKSGGFADLPDSRIPANLDCSL